MTHSREQRGMDPYLQPQISQLDCEISSNCVEILDSRLLVNFKLFEGEKKTNQISKAKQLV